MTFTARFLLLMTLSLPAMGAIVITGHQPKYGITVEAGSARNIYVEMSGCTSCLVNWTISDSTLATMERTTNTLGVNRITIGSTQGNLSVSGAYGSYALSSTKSFTVTATSVEDPTKTATFNFLIAADVKTVKVNEFYQQAYAGQAVTLHRWVIGSTNKATTWAITSQPSGGNGALSDTAFASTQFTATVTGRYVITATSGGISASGIVYVAPTAAPVTITPQQTIPVPCVVDPAMTGTRYDVGPGQTSTSLATVLNGTVPAGSTIILHSVNEAVQVFTGGTATQPIYICGLPDSSGNLAIWDGSGAIADPNINQYEQGNLLTLFPHGSAGGASQNGSLGPDYVVVAGVHFRNAMAGYSYTRSGTAVNWSVQSATIKPAAGQYFEAIGNFSESTPTLTLTTAGATSNGWPQLTMFHTWKYNRVLGGGDPGGGVGIHPLYLNSWFTVVEGNNIDTPQATNQGSCLKNRGVGVVVEYNRCASGYARVWDGADNSDSAVYMDLELFLDLGFMVPGMAISGTDTMSMNQLAAYQENWMADNYIQGNVSTNSASAQSAGLQENGFHFGGDQGTSDLTVRGGDIHSAYNTMDGVINSYSETSINSGGHTFYARWFIANDSNFGVPTVSYGCQYTISSSTTQVMQFSTNLYRQGCVSIATPINGAGGSGGTSNGWGTSSGMVNPWAANVPMETHINGLTSANFILSSATPYDANFIPVAGSLLSSAATSLTTPYPIRSEFDLASGVIKPRTSLADVGARAAAAVTNIFLPFQHIQIQGAIR